MRVLGVDAAGRAEARLRQGRGERLEVGDAARPARPGKNFRQRIAALEQAHDLARGGGAGQQRHRRRRGGVEQRGVAPGLTTKRAPARSAASILRRPLSTVPAPTIGALAPRRRCARITSSAGGVRSVISSTRSPPATRALASGTRGRDVLDHEHRDDRRPRRAATIRSVRASAWLSFALRAAASRPTAAAPSSAGPTAARKVPNSSRPRPKW